MVGAQTNGTRSLLEQSAWLHRLARSLVADPGTAADAAQEALLIAQRHSGDRAPNPRWLSAVLRKVLLQEHRSRRRRGDREAQAARADLDERSAAATVERLETQRRVIEAVRSLEEPYRTTIALRFLEDLPPREVASRMGVPVKTVHTRVERGLARLRAGLDASYGTRQAWIPVLALVARRVPDGPAVGIGAMGTGAILMGTSVKVVAVSTALVLVGLVVHLALGPRHDAAPAAPIDGSASEPPVELAALQTPDAAPSGDRRAAAPLPAPGEPAADPEPSPPAATFRGRVVDLDERPVDGIQVRFDPTTWTSEALPLEQRSALSDARGEFELPLLPHRGRLVGSGRGYATVIAPGVAGTMPPEPPVVVVAPQRQYSGRVADRSGRAIEGAELSLWLPEPIAERFRPGPLAGVVPLARVETSEDGSFALEQVGFVEGTTLRVEASGFRHAVLPLPPISTSSLLIELEPGTPAGGAFAGIVIDPAGRPVEDAVVTLGDAWTRTDAAGSFQLDRDTAERTDRIQAVAPGWQPVSLLVDDVSAVERHEIVLQLSSEARAIEGSVVDRANRPVEGAQVWSFDGQFFAQLPERVGELSILSSKNVEQLMAARGERDLETHTDTSGSFRLSGLLDRPYSIYAMHPATLEVAGVRAVPAGSAGVRVAFDASDPCARVAGRVTTRGGVPLAGAVIQAAREIARADGTRGWRSAGTSFGARTDEDGRFVFEALATRGTQLYLGGEDVPSAQSIDLDSASDLEELVFLVPRRCHVRVILESDPQLADAFELLDGAGTRLNLSFMQGSVTLGSASAGIEGGESALTQTDDSAEFLVLFKEGLEVLRIPITLRPDTVNELRL